MGLNFAGMSYTDHTRLTINGTLLEGHEIVEFCEQSEQSNIRQLGTFVAEWLSENPAIEVRTSGSTGKPKTIRVEKDQMLQSAAMTAAFFGFQKGQTALLCLPVNYIAGKMMIVRALFSRLNLLCIEPTKDPLGGLSKGTKIDFAPLVPMQLKEADPKAPVRRILLGGSPLNPDQEKKLQSYLAEIYQGYGMTETLSHVALRRINGEGRSETYRALPGISFRKEERDCLVVKAPFLNKPVFTNDVVDLINKKEFRWKGRADHMVNSGGIKLFPEEIEKKLFPFVSNRFFLAGLPDDRLGEKICLFIEGEGDLEKVRSLLNKIAPHLDKYEKPREVFFVKNFQTTSSGKINRRETIRWAAHRSRRDHKAIK